MSSVFDDGYVLFLQFLMKFSVREIYGNDVFSVDLCHERSILENVLMFQGDLSAKTHAIVETIVSTLVSEPTAKFLVFSTVSFLSINVFCRLIFDLCVFKVFVFSGWKCSIFCLPP